MFEKAWRRPFVWAGDTGKHQFLSDAQAAFKIFTAISFAVTLFLALLQLSGAVFAAVAFLLSWIFWMAALAAERRARRGLPGPVTEGEARRAEQAGEAEQEEARMEGLVEQSAVKFAAEIFAGVVLVAIVLAVFLVDREMLGLTILLFVAYLTLFGAPYWIAAVHERASGERERLTHRD
jgi:hypothetical protein